MYFYNIFMCEHVNDRLINRQTLQHVQWMSFGNCLTTDYLMFCFWYTFTFSCRSGVSLIKSSKTICSWAQCLRDSWVCTLCIRTMLKFFLYRRSDNREEKFTSPKNSHITLHVYITFMYTVKWDFFHASTQIWKNNYSLLALCYKNVCFCFQIIVVQ